MLVRTSISTCSAMVYRSMWPKPAEVDSRAGEGGTLHARVGRGVPLSRHLGVPILAESRSLRGGLSAEEPVRPRPCRPCSPSFGTRRLLPLPLIAVCSAHTTALDQVEAGVFTFSSARDRSTALRTHPT
jgi:hypothetical protein